MTLPKPRRPLEEVVKDLNAEIAKEELKRAHYTICQDCGRRFPVHYDGRRICGICRAYWRYAR